MVTIFFFNFFDLSFDKYVYENFHYYNTQHHTTNSEKFYSVVC